MNRKWKRRLRKVKPSTVGVVSAAALVATVWGALLVVSPDPVVDVNPTREPTVEPEPEETVVVAIGDSFTGGSDMNHGPVWFDRLADKRGWIAFNESVGGSGYTVDGQGKSITTRAANTVKSYTADLVIIAGGYNDGLASPAEVEVAARRTLSQVQAASPSTDVLVLSPFASGNPPAELSALADTLRQVAKEQRVAYLDVTGLFAGREDLIGSDHVHPTDAGHALMTERIGAALRRLGLPKADAYRDR